MSMLPRLLVAPVLALIVAGCGGSSSGGGGTPVTSQSSGTSTAPQATAPADPVAAEAEITKTWETFFASSTKVNAAKALLENGDQLGPALKKAQQEDKATGGNRSAKVKKIVFTSATQANVSYKLHVGTTVLNSSGVAVLQGGHWKVSKITFCTLVELGNNEKPVPSC